MVKKINFKLFSLFEPKVVAKSSKKAGLPPGSLVYVGPKREKKTRIFVIDYDGNQIEEKEIHDIEICGQYKKRKTVSWINVDGIEQVDVIAQIIKHFEIHPLVAEDILNTNQRPKMEDHGDYLFICLKMLMLDETSRKIISEHVSIILGEDYVLTFQENISGDVFNIIRDRIRQNKGRIRKVGADYLAYALMDSILDNYFVVLESVEEMIVKLENKILEENDQHISQQLHLLKRDMIFLRKKIAPVREVISLLLHSESGLIRNETDLYFRDCYDHTNQIIDNIESNRDLISGLHDVYLSTVSNRMNEVMKVLTIYASIFIPLTFVVGIYGMNFEYMPELKWKWGYFSVLGFMAIIAASMLFYFKKRKWI